MKIKTPFEEDLRKLINKYCMENESDTPDWILAEYLFVCLENWDSSIKKREEWYGRKKGMLNNLSSSRTP